jgi:predicted nucleotide-binding protein
VSPDTARSKITGRIAKGKEMRARQGLSHPEYSQLENDATSWRKFNLELLKQLFSTSEISDEYSESIYSGPIVLQFSPGAGVGNTLEDLYASIDQEVACLSSIVDRLEIFTVASSATTEPSVPRPTSSPTDYSKAFVVHGHDGEARESAARFLENLGITPIILHEQANRGKTLIEKLEHYGDVSFAVILLTPDDEGRPLQPAGSTLRSRARQNVVLELGYFVGKLGRKNVCALYKEGVELPSDWDGVAWVGMDSRGAWRLQLARELKAAGFAIDMNAAL